MVKAISVVVVVVAAFFIIGVSGLFIFKRVVLTAFVQ